MGKKKATTGTPKKGNNKGKAAKSPFAVATANNNKKKPKEVKSNLKKVRSLFIFKTLLLFS